MGHAAVVGEGIAQDEARHGDLIFGMGLRQPAVQVAVGLPAVVVVGIDHREGLADQLLRRQHRLPGAPGLGAPLGNAESLRHGVQILEGIVHLHIQPAAQRLDAITDPLPEIRLDVLPDDKDQLVESGGNGIVDGIVHDDLIVQPHRLQLLDAPAEPGPDSSRHDQQCRSHHVNLPRTGKAARTIYFQNTAYHIF